jgi:hypothetical protein
MTSAGQKSTSKARMPLQDQQHTFGLTSRHRQDFRIEGWPPQNHFHIFGAQNESLYLIETKGSEE